MHWSISDQCLVSRMPFFYRFTAKTGYFIAALALDPQAVDGG
jgi:hypothetical protein